VEVLDALAIIIVQTHQTPFLHVCLISAALALENLLNLKMQC